MSIENKDYFYVFLSVAAHSIVLKVGQVQLNIDSLLTHLWGTVMLPTEL